MSDHIDPAGHAELEAGLRRAFGELGDSIDPQERLASIRAEVAGESGGRGTARWLAPVAASVGVLLVASIAWLLLRPDGRAPIVVGTPTATVTELLPSPEPTEPAPSTPTATTAPDVGVHSVPVYYVGPGSTAKPWLLYRTFLPGQQVAGDATALAGRAVAIALTGRDDAGHTLTAYEGYLQPWRPGTTATVTVGTNEIQVVLSQPGLAGLAADQQRIAVQQLVWTATAAAGANVPVRVTTGSGAPIFETLPGGVYRRAAPAYEDLAPLWITEPSRYVALPAGRAVVVTGQACVFEATVSWELSRGGAVVKSGFTNATSGCPERGTYSIDLGVLAAGDYSIRVFEVSAADGSVFTQTREPFTVR